MSFSGGGSGQKMERVTGIDKERSDAEPERKFRQPANSEHHRFFALQKNEKVKIYVEPFNKKTVSNKELSKAKRLPWFIVINDRYKRTPMGKEKWWCSTVLQILTNEKYKGDALLQKEYTTDFLTKKKRL